MIDIEALVHDYMDGESESNKLWPSALGGCPLKERYRLEGARKTHPMPGTTRWKLYRYGWYETPIVEALRWYAEVEDEVAILEQVRLEHQRWSGKVDIGMLEYATGNLATIIEVKSISPYAINKKDLPYKHHLLQVHCYASLASHMYEKLPSAYIVYISRWNDDDMPAIRQLDVTPTREDLEAVQQEMHQFECVLDKEGPIAPTYPAPTSHPWDCMSNFWNNVTKSKPFVVQCPYFGHCWPGEVDPVLGYCEGEGRSDDVYIPF